jgi:hypothetical protein
VKIKNIGELEPERPENALIFFFELAINITSLIYFLGGFKTVV